MKLMDKLKNKIKFDKKLLIFSIVIAIIGIISGSILVTILNHNDKILLEQHLNNFLNNIENNKLDYIFVLKNNIITNILYIIIIWLLGISIIGLPIIVILYFFKNFILGFSIGSILTCFKLKGIIFSIIYIFPSGIFYLIVLSILTMYSLSFSIKIIYSIIKKTNINFKLIINKYAYILIFSLIITIITSLYDTFAMPNLIKSLIQFIR